MGKKRMENKMQDGFDTRFEKWFLDRFGKDYRDTYFMGDMYDFIASEISKAKREVLEKVALETRANICECGEKWKDSDLGMWIESELDKLNELLNE